MGRDAALDGQASNLASDRCLRLQLKLCFDSSSKNIRIRFFSILARIHLLHRKEIGGRRWRGRKKRRETGKEMVPTNDEAYERVKSTTALTKFFRLKDEFPFTTCASFCCGTSDSLSATESRLNLLSLEDFIKQKSKQLKAKKGMVQY
ncbi:hypothetical protein LXL04_017855 [Taraxacum kok-saghyz]